VARYASQHAFWRAPAVLGGAMARARNATLTECAMRAADVADADAAAALPPRYGCPPANYATRYLCGHGPPCADPPDEASFEQARRATRAARARKNCPQAGLTCKNGCFFPFLSLFPSRRRATCATATRWWA
jgi:hypothetical protein